MDGSHFDALTRTLTARLSRRVTLGGLATGLLLAVSLGRDETTVLAKKKKKCPKLRPNRCGKKCCKAFEACKKGKCIDHCDDKKLNFGETDTDCGGGDCAPCPAGLKCKQADDCLSGICRATGVSGTLRCHECTRNEDCTTDFTKPFCANDRCVECRTNTDCQNTGRPHCLTGASPTRDGTCVECLTDSHCPLSELCNPITNRCNPCASTQRQGGAVQAADCIDTCANGVQDGDETDVDCGGSCATKCVATQRCASGSDCQSGACSAQGRLLRCECVNDAECAELFPGFLPICLDAPEVGFNKGCTECREASDCPAGFSFCQITEFGGQCR